MTGTDPLERSVLIGARKILNNPHLTMKDILECRVGHVEMQEGEVLVRLADLGINVVVEKKFDKRK
jgi:hypothetical protein